VDVEKTIEFILASEARLQARFEAGEEQAKAYVERATAAAARAEAEMAEIRQTLQQTAFIQQEQARILVRIEKNVEDLAVAQQRTEAMLSALIESLRHGKNGSNGGKQ
jgi:hypothetical protein